MYIIQPLKKAVSGEFGSRMIIDVHCHVGYSARRISPDIERFSFEKNGALAHSGFDSYFSPRMLGRLTWWALRRMLKVDPGLPAGDALDDAIARANDQHWSRMATVDRLVLLAFDEYHDDAGVAHGPVHRKSQRGSDLYVSNSLVRAMCRQHPKRYLFGASIHPYRIHDGRTACDMLEEVAASGAALIKWLPIHQNMRAEDPRTIAFLRRAAALKIPMLIHYGGEMSLGRQHMEFESPLPMLDVLRQLKRESAMPTVVVAHAATPSFPWQGRSYARAFHDALVGEFANDPLYADISALAAFGRSGWLPQLAKRHELHRKLVWGTDYPIPVLLAPYWRLLWGQRGRIASIPSWVERDLALKRALGFDECVFTQAAQILRVEA